jgi:hypothetical protein
MDCSLAGRPASLDRLQGWIGFNFGRTQPGLLPGAGPR